METYILDFEYAGYDDLAKLTNDWVLQPEFPLKKKTLMINFGRIEQIKAKLGSKIFHNKEAIPFQVV